jgi:ABC-type multidrug transport system ATPase subunit
MSIQVEHVSKIFDQKVALNDISFTVNSGEIAGFIGPNGAGKSTTMNYLFYVSFGRLSRVTVRRALHSLRSGSGPSGK